MSAVTQARTPGPRDLQPRDRTGGAAIDRDEKLLLSVVEAARRIGVGRTLMYELVLSGQVRSVHVGRLRKVPVDALRAYVSGLGSGHEGATAT